MKRLLKYIYNPIQYRKIFFSLSSGKMCTKTLKDFGYGFNTEGQLRKLDIKSGLPGSEPFEFIVSKEHSVNQQNYESLGEAITAYIYELLETRCSLQKLTVSDGLSDISSFIYTSKDALNKEKLLILIHGSGVVRAGQWARSLIINDCLKTGTQFEYIMKAIALDYGVIVTNTNDNYREINNKKLPIPGSKSPEEHMDTVWNLYVKHSKAKNIFIVAHSYGGVVTIDFVSRQFANINKRLTAIAFTDSVHSILTVKSPKIASYLREITRNWVTSQLSLDAPVTTSATEITKLSAGHTKHEMTSSTCINSVFNYFEEKYVLKKVEI